MFEGDLKTLSTRDLLESCADTQAAEQDAAARQLEHAVEYADRFHPDAVADRADCAARVERRAGNGRERAVVLGGDGCPPVLEFCVSEFGVVLGISPGVARDRIATALALRSRFPFLWARLLDRKAIAWKARNLARDCEKLSLEAALSVDREVAPILDTISPTRLAKIIKAAKIRADPARAKAEADAKAKERGVWISHTDEHGTKTTVIKASSADTRRHYAGLNEIAKALVLLGDKRGIDARRATAVGIMADHPYANELLAQARAHHQTTPTPEPTPASEPASTQAPDPASAPAHTPPPTDGLAPAPAHRRAAVTGGPAPASAPAQACKPSGDDDLSCLDVESHPDDEADRDAPHPSFSDLPDPLDQPSAYATEPFDLRPDTTTDGEPMTVDEQRALTARLAQIKRDAYTRDRDRHRDCRCGNTSGNPAGECCGGGSDDRSSDLARGRSTPPRPGKTEVYVHLTDHTLATGTGVIRAEEIGPLLAAQLTEVVGYGPYIVKPVIDLNKAVSSDPYEATNQIREHIKLIHPAELFPYGTRETTNSIDLDHIKPYDPLGPPGQTNTQNLAPLGRFGRRVKTHARGWKVRRIDPQTIEWTTPHGFVVRVDPTGTQPVPTPPSESSQ
ncbi:hypothetical protein ACFVWG_05305 [Kribbella sp. NPDC058245]|uniref:hypothetical protein n=1 Tax=Kribbella sp. NPDC058245 TaxID=3346399 RepID=UPI0036E7199D